MAPTSGRARPRAQVIACSDLERAGLERLLRRLGVQVAGDAPVAVAAGLCCLRTARELPGHVIALVDAADGRAARQALRLGALSVVPAANEGLLALAVRAAAWGLAVLPQEGCQWRRFVPASAAERREERRRRLAALLAEGMAAGEIAAELGVSVSWVKAETAKLCRRAGLRPRQLRVALMAGRGAAGERGQPCAADGGATPRREQAGVS